MSRFSQTMTAAYFEALYREKHDPWGFAHSAYEQDKYTITLAALAAPRYERALEVGCSIGVFTRRLAERCACVMAVDASATALVAARQRCGDLGNVDFAEMIVPDAFPSGGFDLIVLSEVLYYLDRPDLRRLAARCTACLRPATELVLVHWTGPTSYPLTGDEAVETFLDAMPSTVRVRVARRYPEFRLDTATCRPGGP